jgi:hypothetical protein
MSSYMELSLDPNGPDIKMSWRTDRDGPVSKPMRLGMDLLRDRSSEVRAALNHLTEYVQRNPDLSEERDPGWKEYSSVLTTLQERGRGLHNALFVDDNLRSRVFFEKLQHLIPGAALTVHCSDDVVTLPLGFVFEGEAPHRQGPPSRADFNGFWLDRFNITMLIAGSGCEQSTLTVDPESFATLYALDKSDLESAAEYLGDDRAKLKLLISVEVKDHYDWDSVRDACIRMREKNSVVFVLAHSNGDWLKLSGSEMDCQRFARMLHEGRDENHAALLVLNCCLSASGGDQRSLLSAVAQRGFCGLIGTEAEILNTHALRCGIRVMWGLCAQGKTLGEAFVAMQSAEDLFPLNLLYTCYAERGFRLREPLPELLVA